MQLTKKQLIEHISYEADLTLASAKHVLETQTALVHGRLSNGHDFTLPGIGKLSVREKNLSERAQSTDRRVHLDRSTQNGEFKLAQSLAESVNGIGR